MGKIRLLALTFVAIHFVACSETGDNGLGGEDVTQEFLSSYSGSYQSGDSEERISIWRDGQIELLKLRQVGQENNPAIPKPTYCSFTMTGNITAVVQLNEAARQRTAMDGHTFDQPATHNMIFTVHQISLTDELESDTTSDRGCQNFQEQMNQRLPVYKYGMELYGSGTFRLHTRDEGDYQGGERTDSTLDEVFVRE